ncbi:unnamed protein product [Orchesella dallaii]|uniref:F-box domain-containing protein n=1 Tax=Orchesella dallaii TaxID=48710 RepID=A0ABP1PYX0_9HEXA
MDKSGYNFFADSFYACCWSTVLKYITEPEDLQALLNSSSFFREKLQARMISELVMPTLLEKEDFSKGDLLTLRLLNKGMTRTVDDFLLKDKPYWLRFACTLSPQRSQQLARFQNDFAPQILAGTLVSEFLTLSAPGGKQMEVCVTFLHHIGDSVRNIHLEMLPAPDIRRYGTVYSVAPTYQDLTRLLSQLPLLRSFGLTLTSTFDGVYGEAESRAIAFPSLPELTTMKISFPSTYTSVERKLPRRGLLLRLLQSYGGQLEKLSWDMSSVLTLSLPNLLSLDDEFSLPVSVVNLSNLVHMELSDLDDDETADAVFRVLSMQSMTKLRVLDVVYDFVPVKGKFLPALMSVRESLEELHLPRLELRDVKEEEDESTHLNAFVKELPNLRKIVVRNVDMENAAWSIFRDLFPYLEELRFEPDLTPYSSRRFPDKDVDVTRLRLFFRTFPRLHRIVWIAGAKKTVLTRNMVAT